MKCDETKPLCRRCQNAGRECGYAALAPVVPHPPRRKGFAPIQIRKPSEQNDCSRKDLALIHHQPPLLPPNGPSTSIPGDKDEHRYFQLFHEQVAVDLCGYFETPFWTQFILRECHREPAIKHEIIALSALCKASVARPGDRDSHRQFAFMQQSKALRCIRKDLSRGSVRLALIASLIFSSFESFHGNVETATQHISSGVRLLDYWQNEKANIDKYNTGKGAAKLAHPPATVDPEISGVLARLELQILTFLTMNPVSDQTLEGTEDAEIGYIPIPDRFLSLEEGLPYAVQICMLSLHHVRKCAPYKTSPPTPFSDSIMHNKNILMSAISSWKSAFAPLFHTLSLNASSPEHLGALQFDVCVRVFETIIATSTSADETIYDSFTERFQYIVNSSREILQKDHDLRVGAGPRLQFDMGLIMPLFFTATRCRDGTVRRLAIALLRKWKGRNGVWDGVQAASVADWIVRIEEEVGCDKEGYAKDEWRVKMHTLKWSVVNNGQGDEICVECLQAAGDACVKVRKANLPCR